MTPPPYQKQHLKSLTGLRFLAALAVFFAHLPGRWPEFEFGTLPFGAAGVGFFYVLSGFILTYVYGSRLNHESENPDAPKQKPDAQIGERFSYKKFYIRRFARIWPLHIVTLLISLFLVIGVGAFFNSPNPVGKLLVNACLLQSWIPNYQWIYSLNGPAWSLSVEAFFYVMFPFLLLGGAKKFAGKFLLITIGTIIALFAINQFVPSGEDSWVALNAIIHTNPLMRLFEFATGVGCGFYYLKRIAGCSVATIRNLDTVHELVAVAALIAFFGVANWFGLYSATPNYGIPESFWYWFRFCGAAPVFALLVLTFSSTQGLVARALSCRLMVYLGEISYSFYMIHMGVMLVLARQEWIDGWWVTMGIAVCSFVFSIFLASMLYQLVERPCRRWIVGVCEGQGIGFVFKTIASSFVDWVRIPWFVPLVVLTSLASWFVVEYKFDVHSQRHIASIIASTPAEIRDVKFEEDATLLGMRTVPIVDGGLVFEFVWELNNGRRSIRFMKLIDGDKKIIGRGNANQDLFDSITGEDTVIDRVRVGPDQLKGVKSIAIGFFERKRSAAVVDRGPRDAKGRQLYVWKSE